MLGPLISGRILVHQFCVANTIKEHDLEKHHHEKKGTELRSQGLGSIILSPSAMCTATYGHSFKDTHSSESLSRNALRIYTSGNLDFVNAFVSPADESAIRPERRRIDMFCVAHIKRKSTTCRVQGQSVPEQEGKSWTWRCFVPGPSPHRDGFKFPAAVVPCL